MEKESPDKNSTGATHDAEQDKANAKQKQEETVESQATLQQAFENNTGESSDNAAQTEKLTSEQKKIDTLEAEVAAAKDKYLRMVAEFDNYKKRMTREYERITQSAAERVISDLIEIRENFDRGLKSVDTPHGSVIDAAAFIDGIKLIFSKFDDVLKKHGLSLYAEEGEPFNPQLHDALMKAAHPLIAEDHITAVYERGYKLNGTVIRHAKVVVSAGAEKEKKSDVFPIESTQAQTSK